MERRLAGRIYNVLSSGDARYRRDPGDRVVKTLLLIIMACALTAAPLAHARDRGFSPRAQAQGQGQAKKAPGQGQAQRGDRGRQHGGQDKGNQNRLSEEQRRELNRDLDRANREIYRRR
jgi:Ni/Co efflux regulator RcnB